MHRTQCSCTPCMRPWSLAYNQKTHWKLRNSEPQWPFAHFKLITLRIFYRNKSLAAMHILLYLNFIRDFYLLFLIKSIYMFWGQFLDTIFSSPCSFLSWCFSVTWSFSCKFVHLLRTLLFVVSRCLQKKPYPILKWWGLSFSHFPYILSLHIPMTFIFVYFVLFKVHGH